MTPPEHGLRSIRRDTDAVACLDLGCGRANISGDCASVLSAMVYEIDAPELRVLIDTGDHQIARPRCGLTRCCGKSGSKARRVESRGFGAGLCIDDHEF